MIVDKISNLKRYENIHPNFKAAVDYINKHDLSKLDYGKLPIDGDNVFVVRMNTDTYTHETTPYEIHKKYADLHIVVDPREKYYYEDGSIMDDVIKPWADSDDMSLFKHASRRFSLHPNHGEFLFFFPGEGHAPKTMDKLDKIDKIIFKIKI